jgi:Raf kinase inhibitor-like YbhB/YbcL family protein
MTKPLVAALLAACVLSACGSEAEDSPNGNPGSGGAGGGSATDAGGNASDASRPGDAASAALVLTSSVFHDGQTIPQEYRCVAPSPDLSWSGGPTGAKGWAVVLKDVTPGISNGFLHWVLFDVPVATRSLAKGIAVGFAPPDPAGAHQAPIWNGTTGFNGPCGGQNTYELTLHALDVAALPGLDASSTGPAAVAAIEAHSLARTTMTVLSHP